MEEISTPARSSTGLRRRTGASAESIPGVGLGLSIAKKIVHAHGGELTVKSTPGEGSTFSVRLRLARRGVADVKPEPAKP